MPAGAPIKPGKGGHVEATQDVVEETVHLAVKRLQRMSVPVLFGADRDRQPDFLPPPGNEITKSHDKHLLPGWILSIPAGPCPPPLDGGTQAAPAGWPPDQATSLAFSFTPPI